MQCDVWLDIKDHRCTREATETVIVDKPVQVKGKAMYGTYPAGEWHFCTQHHKLFKAGRGAAILKGLLSNSGKLRRP